MSGRDNGASEGKGRGLAIGGYAISIGLLVVSVICAWRATSRYAEARSLDTQIELTPQVRRYLERIAPDQNPLVRAEELRSSAGWHLAAFIAMAIATMAGLAGSGYLFRRTPSGDVIAGLPERIGFPRWLPWEPVLAGLIVVVLGMGPLSSLLPEPEGLYEVTKIEVEIAKEDFEGRFRVAPGSQPRIFVQVKQNGEELVNTADGRRLVEAHTATFESPFRVDWRHKDAVICEVRDDDPIGSKVLMRGGGVRYGAFPLKGTYRTGAGSTITFTTKYVGE